MSYAETSLNNAPRFIHSTAWFAVEVTLLRRCVAQPSTNKAGRWAATDKGKARFKALQLTAESRSQMGQTALPVQQLHVTQHRGPGN